MSAEYRTTSPTMTDPSMPQPVLFPDAPHWGGPPMPTARTPDPPRHARSTPSPPPLPQADPAMPQPFAAPQHAAGRARTPSGPSPPMPVPYVYGPEPAAEDGRRASVGPPMPQPVLAMPEPPARRSYEWAEAATAAPADPPRQTSPVTATTETVRVTSQQPGETKPMVVGPAPAKRDQFSHSLLGSSTRDCETCCLSCWCPCITYSQNVTRYRHLREHGVPHPTGGDDCAPDCWYHCALTALVASGWILQMGSRSNVRSRYQIPGNALNDCCASWLCMPCELTQESLEMDEEERHLVRRPTIIDI